MFSKKYLEDQDLEFLKDCDNKDLVAFADLLVYGDDDKKRISESLSETRLYQANYPNNMKAVYKELIHEFQLFGGDTIANSFRGHGVTYSEILKDVCDKKKVSYNKSTSIARLEMYLLQKLVDDTLDNMDEVQLKDTLEELKLDSNDYNSTDAMKDAIAIALMSPQFVNYILQFILRAVAPKLAGQLLLVGGVGLARLGGMLVPAINIAMAAWMLKDITGPAFRVIIPGVIMIIYMRKKYQTN